MILETLGSAFGVNTENRNDNFLSFIGYPPVLDAIVTLLHEERNHHKLLLDLNSNDSDSVEVGLLHKIAAYIMKREREEKVIPNILATVLSGYPAEVRDKTRINAFNEEEQCVRLISHTLGRHSRIDCSKEPSVNEKYEEQMGTWLPEHPFLSEGKFRNIVFESIALATIMASGDPSCIELVRAYVGCNKRSYHLVYLLDKMSSSNRIPIEYIDILIDSALEFRSSMANVHIDVDGPSYEDTQSDSKSITDIEIDIEVVLGKSRENTKVFSFHSNLNENTSVNLGNRLAEAYISLPCDVVFPQSSNLDFTAPISISAKNIELNSKTLTLRHGSQEGFGDSVLLESMKISSTLEEIIRNEVMLLVAVSDLSGVAYPIIKYTARREALPKDSLMKEKYLRLKRILMEFRSHKRGSLARFKDKVENKRVLRNKIGDAILARLKADKILTSSEWLYYIQSDELDKHFDMSWPDWKHDRISERLVSYLRSINVT